MFFFQIGHFRVHENHVVYFKPVLAVLVTYRGVHEIKHFACERDFYVHEFTRIKHISSHSIFLISSEIIHLKH